MPIPSPISIDRSRRLARPLLAALAALAALSPAAGALAEPTPQERSMAAALFQEGRALMNEGKLAEACPKLAESHRLDPAGGTLLNLALCHEREGKIATAWVEYREALSIAKRDGRADREEAASAAVQKLEGSLSRLTIVVPAEAKAPGMVIKLDGVPLPAAAWGTKIPVDPGKHAVVAGAPGRRPWSSEVEIGKAASEPTLTIAPLAEAPQPPAGAQPQPTGPQVPAQAGAGIGATTTTGSGQRMIGYVLGGVGIAGLAVGTGFGIGAISKQGKANDACPGTQCANQEAVDLNQGAKTFATVSNIAFGVGLAGLAAGTILVLTAPRGDAVSVGVAVAAHPSGGGAAVRGAF